MNEDIESQFEFIMKENDMSEDWEPVALDEFLLVLASISSCNAQLAQMALEFYDNEEDEDLNFNIETVRMLRKMYQACESFLDAAVLDICDQSPHMIEEVEDDYDDDEDEF